MKAVVVVVNASPRARSDSSVLLHSLFGSTPIEVYKAHIPGILNSNEI